MLLRINYKHILKKIKFIFTNFIFFIFFISTFDLLLGRFLLRGNPPVSSVPYALWNLDVENDISSLYDSKNKKIIYKRDVNGYRNFKKNNNKIILTIGGSTTDQRYVSEKNTWQYLINKKLKDKNVSIINGGVPGQTSAGHLYSINNWHSKSLDKNKVKKIIFYIGANDFIIFNKNVLGHNLRLFLANYSFIYSKLRKIRYLHMNASSKNNNNLTKRKSSIIVGKKSNFDFLVKGNFHQINIDLNNQSKVYRNLFKKLLVSTIRKFPYAEIYVVQQQLPGCIFHSKYIVENRYPIIYENDYFPNLDKTLYSCIMLGKVFIEQDKALDELDDKFRPKVIKMYLEKIISEEGVYDDMHTNNLGSKKIADYLFTKISF